MKMSRLSMMFALGAVAAGCRMVPISGRTQFIVVTEGYENGLGVSSYQEYKSKYKPTSNEAQQEVLRRVGKALAEVSGQANFDWEFNVLDSSIENAFCLPGGKVAVYNGIMKMFGNEAELACVVAHEVGHAIARHGGERMSWGYLKQIGTLGLSTFGGETAQTIYGIGSEYGVMLPFSRSNETEADLIGLHLMAKAGYDPKAAVDFWQRFSEKHGAGDIITSLTSTHPCNSDRIADLKEKLADARKLYDQSPRKRGFGVKLENGIPVSGGDSPVPAN